MYSLPCSSLGRLLKLAYDLRSLPRCLRDKLSPGSFLRLLGVRVLASRAACVYSSFEWPRSAGEGYCLVSDCILRSLHAGSGGEATGSLQLEDADILTNTCFTHRLSVILQNNAFQMSSQELSMFKRSSKIRSNTLETDPY